MDETTKFDDYLVKFPGKNSPDLYFQHHKGELELCRSKEKIFELLKLYQKQKRIKKCVNLKLMSSSHAINNFYPIQCTKQVLYWHVLQNKKEEPEVLLGCPPNCQFYKSAWLEKIKNAAQFILKKFRHSNTKNYDN